LIDMAIHSHYGDPRAGARAAPARQ